MLGDAILEAALEALREKLFALEVEPEQRKQVTVLFLDFVSSTRISRALDPEDALTLFNTLLARAGRIVETQGGRVVRTMGDGLLAIFGYPTAQENDPDCAIGSGLEIITDVATYNTEAMTRLPIERCASGLASARVRWLSRMRA